MSALDGETLTLPSGLATLAGFGSGVPDSDYADPQGSRIAAAMMQAGDAADTDKTLNGVSLENTVDQSTDVTRQFANLQPAGPWRADQSPTATTTPAQGWRETVPTASEGGISTAPDSNLSGSSPHPLYGDSRFWQAYKQDPKAATAMYSKLTGRDLKSDHEMAAAQSEENQKADTKFADEFINKGGKFDVSGTPLMPVTEQDPNSPLAGKVKGYEPVAPMQEARLRLGFKAKGVDPSQFMPPVPAGLTSDEAIQFRQTVKQVASDTSNSNIGGSNLSWEAKIQKASQVVHQQMWNKQQTQTAVQTNPAVASSQKSGMLASLMAKTANLGASTGASVADTVGSVLGTNFRGGRTGAPDMIDSADVQKILPFDRMMQRYKAGNDIWDSAEDQRFGVQ